jgi:ketopantoate reductase
VIGEAFRENGERVREVQKLLNRAIRTEISDNIQGAHWTKLLVNNVANGLEAMTGVPKYWSIFYQTMKSTTV